MACHRSDDPPRSGAPGAPQTITLGYFANLTHAQAVLGVSSGDYARAVAPAALETRIFNAGPSVIEALFARQVDIAYVGPGPAINAQAKSHGEGIRVVAGAAANGVVIVVRKESGIRSLTDLSGKRVATPQLGNTQDISARHYLSQVLHQPTLENVVPVDNAEQSGMFARGQLDAAWVPEPWGQRLITEAGATLLAEEKDLWPSKELGLTVVATTPEFLAEHGDVIRRLLAAHHEWTRKLAADSAAYLGALGDALFALTGKRLGPGILGPALGRVKFTDDPHEETLAAFSRWAVDVGASSRPVDLSGLIFRAFAETLGSAPP